MRKLGTALRGNVIDSSMQKYIDEEMKKFNEKVDEYRKYDTDFIYQFYSEAKEMSNRTPGSGALQRFAALEVLREKSIEKKQEKIFSTTQAYVIVVSTAIMATCAVLTLLSQFSGAIECLK